MFQNRPLEHISSLCFFNKQLTISFKIMICHRHKDKKKIPITIGPLLLQVDTNGTLIFKVAVGQINNNQLCLQKEYRKSYQEVWISETVQLYWLSVAIRKTIRTTIHRTSKDIVEIDSHVAVKSILDQNQAPKLIWNLIEDIRSLVKILGIQYNIVYESTKLTNRMAKDPYL